MISKELKNEIQDEIQTYSSSSRLASLIAVGPFAVKYVPSKWTNHYLNPNPLKISETPALTWGTATYVAPIAFPLSSALYGRVGVVTDFDPTGWQVFDATRPAAQMAYVHWVSQQPIYSELLLTVHATSANHFLRNQFREMFGIDCVLFHPDQHADAHTHPSDVWMAVTDWTPSRLIRGGMSQRLANARFTVLIDEEFPLDEQNLPIIESCVVKGD